jgi:hypothetical protein
VCPDIAFSDIVSPRHDIVIFFPISEPISGKKTPISVQYRDIPVPCQTRYYQYRARYRVFSRYRYRYRVNIGTYPFLAKPDIGFFTDIGPDMVPILQKISGYTDIGTKKNRCHSRCVCNIAIYRYRVLPISGVFLISGTIGGPHGPPAAQARRPLSRRSNWSSLLVLSSADQRGSALGTAYILAHSVQHTDIVYFRYRAFSLISGTIGGPPGPPAAQARRPLSRRSKWSSLLVLSSADQRGSALGTAYMLAHSVLLQKLPWSRVVQHTPSHWQNLKLETGIIEFQVAPFVTVVADIRGARYLLRVWWA